VWQASITQGGPFYDFRFAQIKNRATVHAIELCEQDVGKAIRAKSRNGFVRRRTSQLRAEGVKCAKCTDGAMRFCVAHAAFNVVRNVIPEADGRGKYAQGAFERLLPGTLRREDDPSVEDLIQVLADRYAVSVTWANGVSMRKLVNKRDGIWLVDLQLDYGDGCKDCHLTVFHAATGAIIDTMADMEKVVVDDDDRVENPQGRSAKAKANQRALRPFREGFAVGDVKVTSIYRCERM
jgi:hypothetical protein